jgi:hypothetical protein
MQLLNHCNKGDAIIEQYSVSENMMSKAAKQRCLFPLSQKKNSIYVHQGELKK